MDQNKKKTKLRVYTTALACFQMWTDENWLSAQEYINWAETATLEGRMFPAMTLTGHMFDSY